MTASLTDDRLRKAPCSRCGQDTYRVAYLWTEGRQYPMCVQCFKQYAQPSTEDGGKPREERSD